MIKNTQKSFANTFRSIQLAALLAHACRCACVCARFGVSGQVSAAASRALQRHVRSLQDSHAHMPASTDRGLPCYCFTAARPVAPASCRSMECSTECSRRTDDPELARGSTRVAGTGTGGTGQWSPCRTIIQPMAAATLWVETPGTERLCTPADR